MRSFLKLFCMGCAVLWAMRFCPAQTDGFTLLHIHPPHPNAPAFAVSNPPLPPVFSQPFTYLGSGGQAYAFGSADGCYVLKFFKHDDVSPFWQSLFPALKRRQLKKEKKRLRDFSSYKLCMEELPEETKLLYVHLVQTDHLKTHVKIVDKLHIAHEIDLDQVPFVLQQKAIPSHEYLDGLIDSGENQQAKEALILICDLLIARCRKGIYDGDPDISRNVGFIDGQPMFIDVGRMKRDPRRFDPKIQREDLVKITAKMAPHLMQRAPHLVNYLALHVETKEL